MFYLLQLTPKRAKIWQSHLSVIVRGFIVLVGSKYQNSRTVSHNNEVLSCRDDVSDMFA